MAEFALAPCFMWLFYVAINGCTRKVCRHWVNENTSRKYRLLIAFYILIPSSLQGCCNGPRHVHRWNKRVGRSIAGASDGPCRTKHEEKAAAGCVRCFFRCEFLFSRMYILYVIVRESNEYVVKNVVTSAVLRYKRAPACYFFRRRKQNFAWFCSVHAKEIRIYLNAYHIRNIVYDRHE